MTKLEPSVTVRTTNLEMSHRDQRKDSMVVPSLVIVGPTSTQARDKVIEEHYGDAIATCLSLSAEMLSTTR